MYSDWPIDLIVVFVRIHRYHSTLLYIKKKKQKRDDRIDEYIDHLENSSGLSIYIMVCILYTGYNIMYLVLYFI